jgi:hypothetical protein
MGRVAGSSEDGNEPLGTVNNKESLDELSDYHEVSALMALHFI